MEKVIRAGKDELHLAMEDGSLLELRHGGRNLIRKGEVLFRLHFRSGEVVSSTDFGDVCCAGEFFHYRSCGTLAGVEVAIRIRGVEEPPGTCAFRLSLDRVGIPEGKILSSYEFPLFHLPDEFTVLDPLSEGRLLPPGERYDSAQPYEENDQLGHYPGYCQVQLTAGFDERGGVRLFARDELFRPKRIRVIGNTDGGFSIETFDVAEAGEFRGAFEFELSAFDGDWMEAARPYRDWVYSSGILPAIPPEDPPWVASSPVVVTYAVCGEGVLTAEPNCFIPYRNALPALRRIARATESRIMALPMRWDARGPWTPPLQWPPVGGADSFAELVQSLHEEGHLIGLYGSGVSWTTYVYSTGSVIGPGPVELMTTDPDGEALRYDFKPYRQATKLCLSCAKSRKIIRDELLRVAASGVDFYQLFDQDLGGGVPGCFSREHGHAPGRGPHETAAGREFHAELRRALQERGFKLTIGAEDGAAEPFLGELRFNDLRLWPAHFVPLHAYMFHEIATDFTGNQCMGLFFDCVKSPENLLYRIAQGFAAGALLTVPMRKNGEVDWAGGAPWTMPEPPSEKVLTLVRNLNRVRKRHPEFLLHGRMIPTGKIDGIAWTNLATASGGSLAVPTVLATGWESGTTGERAVILANWSEEAQHLQIDGNSIPVPALDAAVFKLDQSPVRSEKSRSS